MRRREFIELIGGGAVTWPLAARAQRPDHMRRVGVLMGLAKDVEGQARVAAFRHALQQLRWIEGGNVRIDDRWSAGDADRLRIDVTDLVSLKPDLVLVNGSRALAALRRENDNIPVVFVALSDPVGQGFVESLAHPGGNLTGFSLFEPSLPGKLLQVLKDMAPDAARIVVIYHADNGSAAVYLRSVEEAAPTFSVRPVASPVRDLAAIERTIEATAQQPNGALLFPPDNFTTIHRERIVALVADYRVPAIYAYRSFVVSGGLMSYGVDIYDLYRQSATYVDRILKGEKAADLPVQAPTKFEFVINLTTAKALGLTAPQTILGRADEVIE
jgi:putative tryptophan/tyrosine transport system substrate-binding protein